MMTDEYTPTSTKKSYNISEARLKRIEENNERLQEQLALPRIPVSEASNSLLEYCNSTRDPLVPSVWGALNKEEDPFAPAQGGGRGNGCCIIM